MRWPRPAGGGASHGRPDAPRRRQGKKEGGARGEGDPVASTRRLGTPGVVVVATPGGHPQGRQRPVAGPPWGGRRPHEWGGAPTRPRPWRVPLPPPPRAATPPPTHPPRCPRQARARGRRPCTPAAGAPGRVYEHAGKERGGGAAVRGGAGKGDRPWGVAPAAAASTGRGAAPRGGARAPCGGGGRTQPAGPLRGRPAAPPAVARARAGERDAASPAERARGGVSQHVPLQPATGGKRPGGRHGPGVPVTRPPHRLGGGVAVAITAPAARVPDAF